MLHLRIASDPKAKHFNLDSYLVLFFDEFEQLKDGVPAYDAHTVWIKLTGEIIYDYLERFFPVSEYRREDIVSPFCDRNLVKPEAYQMRASDSHEIICKCILPID